MNNSTLYKNEYLKKRMNRHNLTFEIHPFLQKGKTSDDIRVSNLFKLRSYL